MRFIKAEGVPLAITLFTILMGVGGTIIGVLALLDPTTVVDFVDGADKMGTAWAGRNLGLGFAMLVAVALRNSAGYAVAFSGAVWREISDLVAGLSDGGSLNVPFAIVLVIELVCLGYLVVQSLAIDDRLAAERR